ncbi:MAG: DUF4440 domain-containing protein [Gemmatimonadota bacterium]|nr:MAG: DUF4440 domain-containing protein [Gemmatimonadota bacterium]
MRRLATAVLAVPFLAACQPAAAPLSDEDVAALRDLGTAYTEAVLAGDADAVAALYTENAIEMPPDMPSREGRAAIRAAYAAEGGVPQAFTVTSVEIDGLGGLAFDRGTWSWTGVVAAEGEPVTLTGKYLMVVRQQQDGSWLWTTGIWNSDAPMPEPQ